MRRRKGFTLVELSIVLVIIGLLIGGILAAQSMISTSKVNAQVRQIGQFDAMVMNFKTRYNFLPGDAPAFGGNGDGMISGRMGLDESTIFADEIANFWNNMKPDEFQNTSLHVSAMGPNKNVPEAKMGVADSFVIAAGMTADSYQLDKTTPRNVYIITNQGSIYDDGNWRYLALNVTPSFTPLEMLSIDAKMDDGLANSGNIIAGSTLTWNAWIGGPSPLYRAACADGAGAYQTQNSSHECTPLIRIGGSTGDPQ